MATRYYVKDTKDGSRFMRTNSKARAERAVAESVVWGAAVGRFIVVDRKAGK